MTTRIAIQTEIFAVREIAAKAQASVEAQARAHIAEIIRDSGIAPADLSSKEQRASIVGKVREYLVEQAWAFQATGHATDSVDGFISAQAARWLLREAKSPEGLILEIVYG